MEQEIRYTRTLDDVDWAALKAALTADDFDNGRTAEQLHRAFANSAAVCFAWANGEIVGKARVLSDGVCNAYLVDVWTQSAYRRRGIATHMLELLLHALPGQHVYLQSDADTAPFYQKRGFTEQPHGLSCVVGRWLDDTPQTKF
jgi:predicted GNAT family acetyltransferase